MAADPQTTPMGESKKLRRVVKEIRKKRNPAEV
jgi:hypothetical protein